MINPILQEEPTIAREKAHPILHVLANFFSYIFHPIFIPIYAIAFLVFIHPSYFTGFSEQRKLMTVVISTVNLVFFPLLSVALLKAVGFIDSIFLKTRKDRIIPYMACGIFFFWAYTVFNKQTTYPPILSSFVLGVFLAASAALMANIYFKISMHAIGVGGLVGLCIVVFNTNTMLMTWPLAAALLIAGIVCTARFLVSDHTQKDIYTGLALGLLAQLVASWVTL
jgi:hypothetical protein